MIEQPTPQLISAEFSRCFRLLNTPVADEKIQSLSQLVLESMSHQNRYFHQTSHAIELLDQTDAILNLAALFHDTVYLQVDQEFPKPTFQFLTEVVSSQGADVYICKKISNTHPKLFSVLEVFGYRPGDKLNYSSGLNEFLSAVVADVCLRDILTESQLIQVHMCIEATIPFRPTYKNTNPLIALQNRTAQLYKMLNISIKETELKTHMLRAAELANRDVKNFASADPSWFLATTWLLLPERNPALRGDQYTFEDYRQSLVKMEDFFNFLSPHVVFKKYIETPSQENFDLLNERAARNIHIAREYLNIKILSVGLLEALAKETGGDLPIPEMLGKVRPTSQPGTRMEDFLPHPKPRAGLNISLFSLLCDGRALETNFDLRNSPLAAYLYSILKTQELTSLRNTANEFFKSKIEPLDLLKELPNKAFTDIACACKKICKARHDQLENLITNLSDSKQTAS